VDFETFVSEMKKSLVKSDDYYLNEIEEVDDLQPYGKAYFFFEHEVGDTPKEYMSLDNHDKLEILYDYLLKSYAKGDSDYKGIRLDNWSVDGTKIAVAFDIFISNALVLEKRTQERLNKTRVDFANLLRLISADDKSILSNSAYEVMDLEFNCLFENCYICLEQKRS
jgi:hypothetical protein